MKDPVEIAFGKVLRKYRLGQKLSQEKLAELANLDRTYISQIERGLKSPSIKAVFALAYALQVNAHLLIADAETELNIYIPTERQ